MSVKHWHPVQVLSPKQLGSGYGSAVRTQKRVAIFIISIRLFDWFNHPFLGVNNFDEQLTINPVKNHNGYFIHEDGNIHWVPVDGRNIWCPIQYLIFPSIIIDTHEYKLVRYWNTMNPNVIGVMFTNLASLKSPVINYKIPVKSPLSPQVSWWNPPPQDVPETEWRPAQGLPAPLQVPGRSLGLNSLYLVAIARGKFNYIFTMYLKLIYLLLRGKVLNHQSVDR